MMNARNEDRRGDPRVAIAGDAGPVESLLGEFSVQICVEAAKIQDDLMVLGTPRRRRRKPSGRKGSRRAPWRLRPHVGRLGRELRPHRLGEGDRLGGDDVLEWAPLKAGEDGAVDPLGEAPRRKGSAPSAGSAQRILCVVNASPRRRRRPGLGCTPPAID